MKKENPYQPPTSPILVQPKASPPRPMLLLLSVGLLALEMLANLLLTLVQVWYLRQMQPSADQSQILVGSVGLVLVEAPLLWLLIRGKSWPRYVAALLLAMSLYSNTSRLSISALQMLSASDIRNWISNALMIIGVAMLFAPPVSKWFRLVRMAP